jgi:carboxypeptidase Q
MRAWWTVAAAAVMALLGLVAPSAGAHGADAGAPRDAASTDDIASRITGEALTRNRSLALVERLTDRIGGRVTGSPQSKAAAELLLQTLREAGLANVHAEEWALRSRWARGSASARVLAPIDRGLVTESFGWAPGTGGAIEVGLVDGGAPGPSDAPPAAVRGAAVLADFNVVEGEPAYVVRAAYARRLAEAGAAALLVPAGKPERLLDIGCFGNYPKGPLPMLSIAQEDAFLLRRLLAAGAVRLRLEVSNTLDTSPATERNVVAEIPGGALPEESVIVGGHFDSWDTGQGAIDNATGVAVVAETARILKSLGAAPRRTVRFVFWSGEEQALAGSHAYVEAHRAELDRVRAVVVVDHGGGAGQVPRGLEVQGRTDLEPALRKLLLPLRGIGADGVSPTPSFDTDHAFFLAAGVPAFVLWVDEGAYEVHHHAISDTYDKADGRVLALQTAATALTTWVLADAVEPPGKRLAPAEAEALLRRTGLLSSYRLLSPTN